jgi:hypothetical protein
MRTLTIVALLGFAASLFGCSGSFAVRDVETYRKDTRKLLKTRKADIKACYDELLKNDPKVSGVVVVNFKVQEETGMIMKAKIDEAQTAAPEALSQCILDALDGLALDPPDQRKGIATFTWEFGVTG